MPSFVRCTGNLAGVFAPLALLKTCTPAKRSHGGRCHFTRYILDQNSKGLLEAVITTNMWETSETATRFEVSDVSNTTKKPAPLRSEGCWEPRAVGVEGLYANPKRQEPGIKQRHGWYVHEHVMEQSQSEIDWSGHGSVSLIPQTLCVS
jgi:hypothetical protein